MRPYKNRLLIGIDSGSNDLKFYSQSGYPLAVGYTRVVIGKRGPYVEFSDKNIDWNSFYIPSDQAYRIDNRVVFYWEYRSTDYSNVKLYYQKRTVAYADYKIGLCYISPFDLLRTDMQPVII